MFRNTLDKIEWFYDISIAVIDYDYFVDEKGFAVVCWLQIRDDFKVVRCLTKEENGPVELFQQRRTDSNTRELQRSQDRVLQGSGEQEDREVADILRIYLNSRGDSRFEVMLLL